MKKFHVLVLIFMVKIDVGYTQPVEIEHEVGILAGGAHYFGDLNPNLDFMHPGPMGGAFYRLNFGTRLALRNQISYMHIAYKDQYSGYLFNRQRNLSFKSDVLDIHSQIEFNFLDFIKSIYYSKEGWRYTPYLSLGAGVFFFNPKTEYKGQTIELQPLGTEGQNDVSYTGNPKYNLYSWSINYGIGLKYHIQRNVSVGFDFNIHRTMTDYLDDVSGQYVSIISLPGEDRGLPYLLYDRSKELGPAIGTPGRSRGSKPGGDDFATFSLNLTWTFMQPFCPKYGTYN